MKFSGAPKINYCWPYKHAWKLIYLKFKWAVRYYWTPCLAVFKSVLKLPPTEIFLEFAPNNNFACRVGYSGGYLLHFQCKLQYCNTIQYCKLQSCYNTATYSVGQL